MSPNASPRILVTGATGRLGGRGIRYMNLPAAEYKAALLTAGLPAEVAALLSDTYAAIAKDALFDDSKALSRLIGRPTISMAASVSKALQATNEMTQAGNPGIRRFLTDAGSR